MYNPPKTSPSPNPKCTTILYIIINYYVSLGYIFSNQNYSNWNSARDSSSTTTTHYARNDKRRCQVFATILPPIVKIITTPFSEDVVLSDLLKNTVKKLQKKK